MEDVGSWDWVKTSVTEPMMLTEVTMAVTESQSPELMSRLRESLMHAILGDVDGFLNTDRHAANPCAGRKGHAF